MIWTLSTGYPVETHQVVTPDNYVLTMFRIPYGKNSTKRGGKPVLVKKKNQLRENHLKSSNKNKYFIIYNSTKLWL